MSDLVKAALIVAAAIVVAVSIWIYFSPYNSCVRDLGGNKKAVGYCVKALGGAG